MASWLPAIWDLAGAEPGSPGRDTHTCLQDLGSAMGLLVVSEYLRQ